ncbi:ZYRO0A07370p [Zygosaccharomyces rouxii]|uniref:ZYRO0A07370p n=1 Tax=Zygosaccharomyces rouxii (strain ATCC 2623 / CBS 732 / NBRC 1130 / NCYC 568 / NRRL Y-229) TaxID=559307 RepID=C5DPZ5_ZYGRC|nr:uncharacterized protein ZYRO0A07370g [Zygosaccharomyces rouxii]KAH9198723.1 Lipin/Ned1/Smp2-domain-containing protein [Zygosaccharomyces rouxii]CAR25756.1 ZYRO0A07370p [Zygosaccharomyces rouxii]
MQYVERAIGSVSKTWSSINPATLSGGIDVIVVEHPDGTLACSPFHVRFGKFQILKPSQKKVEVIVNGKSTNIPMKLGDSGEAYFVFETSTDVQGIPEELLSSPVMSATSSPPQSPRPDGQVEESDKLEEGVEVSKKLEEPDFLDINDSESSTDTSNGTGIPLPTMSRTKTFQEKLNRRLTQIHIPSKLDNNGDLLLDMEGYKPNKDKVQDTDNQLKQLLKDELGNDLDISGFVKEDSNGNIRIVNPFENHPHHHYPVSPPESPPMTANEPGLSLDFSGDSSTLSGFTSSNTEADTNTNTNTDSKGSSTSSDGKFFIKTLRLSSEQLKCLDLKYGENDLTFSVDQGRALVSSKLFVWRWSVPIVISDIDGTITKSDALGHVMTMFGKDWTHIGVAKLFSEIAKNGYNIMYLTARSTGQADSTRSYLRSIVQNGNRLPVGPVILSPDRTIAALRREVILKKPEVFKIACLNDMRSLYFDRHGHFKGEAEDRRHEKENEERVLEQEQLSLEEMEEKPTPFFAGFGNRITDALSYRTVGVPSSRIFTINPDGEVHMELLELAGYRSSYVFINELVDHFFPPVNNDDDDRSIRSAGPGSPINKSIDTDANIESNLYLRSKQEEKFTDVNFWREPIPDLEELTDTSNSDGEDAKSKDARDGNYNSNDGRSSMLDKSLSHDHLQLSSPISFKNGTPKERSPSTESGRNIKGTSLFRSISPESIDEEDHNASHPQLSTPGRDKTRPPTREEIGQQIYLELGSPLRQPQLLETTREDVPGTPASEISRLNISESEGPRDSGKDTASCEQESDQDGDDEEEEEDDDEEDDDEFDEDEFT